LTWCCTSFEVDDELTGRRGVSVCEEDKILEEFSLQKKSFGYNINQFSTNLLTNFFGIL
jgi:hypothetical protein